MRLPQVAVLVPSSDTTVEEKLPHFRIASIMAVDNVGDSVVRGTVPTFT